MRSFNPKLKKNELKILRGVIDMTMKNDIKVEEELTCHFKVDMRNLTDFDPSTCKAQKCSF